jgi:hypothetical protein
MDDKKIYFGRIDDSARTLWKRCLVAHLAITLFPSHRF